MSLAERPVTVRDIVTAELVECTPDPQAAPAVSRLRAPHVDASPTEKSAEATIEQTGAGPPPKGEV